MQAAKGRLYGGGLAHVARIGGQCRAVWNLFLAESVARYQAEQKFVFYAEMSARLPKLLKEDARLAGLPHRCAQMTVQRLDRALRDCAKSKGKARRGFPKFKRYSDRRDAFSFVGREVRVAGGRVRLPKIGWLRGRGLRLPDDADLKQVAVTQEPRGWHVCVQFDGAAKEYAVPTEPMIGVDRGLTALLAWTEAAIAPPRLMRKAEKHVRRLNRERDRRRKASVNRRRTVARLARRHRQVRQQRQDFLHKLTRAMVDTYFGFAVEDLNLKALMKTRLAKSFADASLGELLRMLGYKAEWAGREWRVLGRFQRSTGVCPDCGWIGPRLRPGIGTWMCCGCGVIHDRDVAASRVILRDATVVRAAGVAPVRREPVSVLRRKRGAVVGDGVEARASVSHREPPANVAFRE
jgi:putative transposase